MRKFLSVIVGAVVAVAVMLILETLSHAIGGAPGSVAAMSAPAKLLVVAGWFLGAFAGALAGLRIGRWPSAAWIVGALVLAGGVANILTIPHPLWMQAAAVLAPVLAVVAALGLDGRRTRPALS